MIGRSSKKRLEKVSGSQYGLLRDLTNQGALDTFALEAAISGIVKDRFELARAMLDAAQLLAGDRNPLVRRSALSRAYYAAYQAARGTSLFRSRRDEDDHERLGESIGRELGESVAARLKELRRLRNDFDYSPYAGPNSQTLYDAAEIDAIIEESIREARELIAMLEEHVEKRGWCP